MRERGRDSCMKVFESIILIDYLDGLEATREQGPRVEKEGTFRLFSPVVQSYNE